nr:MAG TPA: hypothetical protein [Caudoviricetes sp.]
MKDQFVDDPPEGKEIDFHEFPRPTPHHHS